MRRPRIQVRAYVTPSETGSSLRHAEWDKFELTSRRVRHSVWCLAGRKTVNINYQCKLRDKQWIGLRKTLLHQATMESSYMGSEGFLFFLGLLVLLPWFNLKNVTWGTSDTWYFLNHYLRLYTVSYKYFRCWCKQTIHTHIPNVLLYCAVVGCLT